MKAATAGAPGSTAWAEPGFPLEDAMSLGGLGCAWRYGAELSDGSQLLAVSPRALLAVILPGYVDAADDGERLMLRKLCVSVHSARLASEPPAEFAELIDQIASDDAAAEAAEVFEVLESEMDPTTELSLLESLAAAGAIRRYVCSR